MTGKGRRLERLLALRRLSEELDRSDLEIAFAAVAEVEVALELQEASRVDAMGLARTALNGGERDEWFLADAQREVAGWNRGWLANLLQVRAAAVPPAMDKYRVSHREHEQVKKLIEAARDMERVEEDRRTQAAADDWFLNKRMRTQQDH